MALTHIVSNSLFYALVVNGYLLLMMVTTSPRVWGYSDYPDEIKAKVPPQTKEEKRTALIIGLPWMIITFGFPIYSTYVLKANLGGEISFWIAFLNVFLMVALATLGDLVLLDWLIVSTFTPQFVIIPGTDKADYKDFSHHYKAHARAAPILLLLCLLIAGIVWYI